jgi:hypothetical protein
MKKKKYQSIKIPILNMIQRFKKQMEYHPNHRWAHGIFPQILQTEIWGGNTVSEHFTKAALFKDK